MRVSMMIKRFVRHIASHVNRSLLRMSRHGVYVINSSYTVFTASTLCKLEVTTRRIDDVLSLARSRNYSTNLLKSKFEFCVRAYIMYEKGYKQHLRFTSAIHLSVIALNLIEVSKRLRCKWRGVINGKEK